MNENAAVARNKTNEEWNKWKERAYFSHAHNRKLLLLFLGKNFVVALIFVWLRYSYVGMTVATAVSESTTFHNV